MRKSRGLFRACMMPALIIMLVAMQAAAVELNVARQGVVKNVPTQEPYNGCLIVREGPGMEYPVKGHVVNGDTVTIDGTSGNWFRITAPKSGYVWASYITVTDFDTIESENMDKPIDLETLVDNSKPEDFDYNLAERKKLLEDNKVYEIDIDREINP